MKYFLALVLIITGATSCGSSGGSTCLSFDGSEFGGSLSIEGTIETPTDVEGGRSAVMTVSRLPGANSSLSLAQTVGTTCASSSTYRITGLSAGSYTIKLSVDVDGNSSLIDAEDLAGHYDGSVAAPKDLAAAEEISITDESLVNVDFGIAEAQ